MVVYMDKTKLQRNMDFLSIAMEQMDEDSVEYEFVQDVFQNLLDELNDMD